MDKFNEEFDQDFKSIQGRMLDAFDASRTLEFVFFNEESYDPNHPIVEEQFTIEQPNLEKLQQTVIDALEEGRQKTLAGVDRANVASIDSINRQFDTEIAIKLAEAKINFPQHLREWRKKPMNRG